MKLAPTLLVTLYILWPASAISALVISYSTNTGTSTDIIKEDTLYKLEDGQLYFIATSDGDCSLFIEDEKTRVDEKCKDIAQKMEQAASKAMQAQGMSREQMEMIKGMRAGAVDNKPEPTGNQTIAGYPAECYKFSSRTLCFSEVLATRVEKHFDYKDITSAFTRPGEDGFQQGNNPEILKLHSSGYLVKDVEAGGGTPNIPGFNFLPKEAQEKILAQMGSNAGRGDEVGTVLTNVEERDVEIAIPNYQRETIDSFMQKQLR